MQRLLLRAGSAAIAATAVVLATVPTALACACCTETAWRYVETEKLRPQRLAEIDAIQFAKTAKLLIVNEDEAIKGIKDAQADYRLEVERRKDRLVFSFRDGKDRTGTLTLRIPETVAIFEVDPRGDNKDAGLGPSLYKEWRLTADAAGDGLFKQAAAGRKITLVLHGRGNACTSSDQFTDWSLLVYGPKDKITLYGALDSAGR